MIVFVRSIAAAFALFSASSAFAGGGNPPPAPFPGVPVPANPSDDTRPFSGLVKVKCNIDAPGTQERIVADVTRYQAKTGRDLGYWISVSRTISVPVPNAPGYMQTKTLSSLGSAPADVERSGSVLTVRNASFDLSLDLSSSVGTGENGSDAFAGVVSALLPNVSRYELNERSAVCFFY